MCTVIVVSGIALATALRFALAPIGEVVPFITYFPVVFAVALVCGTRPGLWAAAGSAIVAYFAFLAPALDWTSPDPATLVNVAAFLGTNALLCVFAGALRRSLSQREQVVAMLDSLLANAPVGFAFFDRDRRYVRINDVLARINGLSAESHIGRTTGDVIPHNAAAVDPVLDRVFTTGEAIADLEITGQTAAEPGVVRHWLTGFYPVPGNGGTALAGAIVFEITERKRAELALAHLNAELEARVAERTRALETESVERLAAEAALRQSQKMEAVGQLTGGVAHDFNNLLTIIMGNLETLQRHTPGSEERLRRAAGHAMDATKRAAILTHRLLAFSRRQALDPRPVDVNKLVSGMSDLLQRTLGEQIEIESVLAGGLWRCHADPNQLESAILNLAVNARDAMASGGRLTIETANTFLDEPYAAAHAEVSPGQYVVVCVTDTGTGMDRQIMERAFEPFFTTKEFGRGTGLGLSQVYGFVKQSEGHVKLYSEPGHGTTAKMYLPRSTETGSDLARPISGGIAGRVLGETILVVEDNNDVRAYSADILRELGYRVVEAADGEQALGALAAANNISLLFTDVGLPGRYNGRSLAEEARRRVPSLRVLFTTGYARNAIVHAGRLDPGVLLIVKPFTFAELGAKVRQALDGGAT